MLLLLLVVLAGQGGQWRGGLRRRQLVVAADDVTVDDAVLVAGDEAAVAGGTREALDVVDGRRLAGERAQHQLARRDVLTAAGARARRTEHPAHADRFLHTRAARSSPRHASTALAACHCIDSSDNDRLITIASAQTLT